MQAYPFSDKELDAFQTQIQEELDRAKKSLRRLRDEAFPAQTEGKDRNTSYGDDGKKTQITERIADEMERETHHVKELEAALTRIENKTYGICKETGEYIRKERLQAFPTARTSLKADGR